MVRLDLYNDITPISLGIRNSLAKPHQPIYFNSVYVVDTLGVAPGTEAYFFLKSAY